MLQHSSRSLSRVAIIIKEKTRRSEQRPQPVQPFPDVSAIRSNPGRPHALPSRQRRQHVERRLPSAGCERGGAGGRASSRAPKHRHEAKEASCLIRPNRKEAATQGPELQLACALTEGKSFPGRRRFPPQAPRSGSARTCGGQDHWSVPGGLGVQLCLGIGRIAMNARDVSVRGGQWRIRLCGTVGKVLEIPRHHRLKQHFRDFVPEARSSTANCVQHPCFVRLTAARAQSSAALLGFRLNCRRA